VRYSSDGVPFDELSERRNRTALALLLGLQGLLGDGSGAGCALGSVVRPRLRLPLGLGLIEKHLAWYLIHGRLSARRGQAVSAYVDRLVTRLRPHAQDLVDAFGYEPEHLRAPIATGAEAERQAEARAYYAAERASGTAPVAEKSLKPKKKR
jgi:hypothetical protein